MNMAMAMVQLQEDWLSTEMCFGGHGEAFEEVHSLIEALAAPKLKKQGMAIGQRQTWFRPGADHYY